MSPRPAAAALFLLRATAAAAAPNIGIFPTIRGNYLNAYKEWVGQEGATSTVLPSRFEADQLESIFQSVNAVLIPGGPFGDHLAPLAKALITRAVQANSEGDYFPIWGSCLGFEWILQTFAGVDGVVPPLSGGFDSEQLPAALNFTAQAAGSRTYSAANDTLMGWLATEPITYNAHEGGITPDALAGSAPLAAAVNALSTSVDRKGVRFVAQIEHKSAPIYGSQFHPEKIQFVPTSRSYPNIPRTPEAVAGAKYFAQFFVSEAAKNHHGQK